MNASDNVKMNINIGDERLQLNVPFNRQDAVRDAEKAVKQLYENWRQKWPTRNEKEILAMIAFQFSSLYQDLLKVYNEALALAKDCDSTVSTILKSDSEVGLQP